MKLMKNKTELNTDQEDTRKKRRYSIRSESFPTNS